MQECTRRGFMKTSLAASACWAFSNEIEAAPQSLLGSDIVSLGKTGIKTSRLAQGTGFNGYDRSSAHTRLGKEKFDRLLRHSLDRGIRFLDMADLYGSHPFIKEVIRGIPRNRYTLLTKIWPRKEKWNDASGGARTEMDRFRQELGVEQIDLCLIHCMMNGNWASEYARIREELSELKQKKIVRAVGVSCHDLNALKYASQDPWVDAIFARINHKGGKEYSMDGTVEEVSSVLKTARKNHKAVIGMKIFGAGKLNRPEEKDASLRYVLQNQLVDAITIGMLSPEEVNDTMERMSLLKP